MASETPLLQRFTATERLLHWVHTVGFVAMLGTGLVLYVPDFADVLGARPQAKAAHLVAATAWLVALALVALLGNRNALRATRREIETFSQDDYGWLRRRPAEPARFNAGQKLHTIIQSAYAALFVLTGMLLWLGERVRLLRLPGTIVVHDVAMYFAVIFLLGHLWLSLVWPPTRHAMRGIVLGTVRRSWAERHHPRWARTPVPAPPWTRPGRRALLISLAVVACGVGAGLYLAHDALDGRTGADRPLGARR